MGMPEFHTGLMFASDVNLISRGKTYSSVKTRKSGKFCDPKGWKMNESQSTSVGRAMNPENVFVFNLARMSL